MKSNMKGRVIRILTAVSVAVALAVPQVAMAAPGTLGGAAPDGAGFKDWVFMIAGNIFAVVLIVRGIGHYAKREWGELVVHILAGIVIAAFLWNSDAAMAVLLTISKFFIP